MIRFKSVLAPLIVCMTLSGSSSGGIRRIGEGENEERAALEGMLSSYPVEQLVEEVLTAWEELSSKNEELVSVKQRVRVLELDLAEREDEVAPEIQKLKESEASLREAESRIIHLERLLSDTKEELSNQSSSIAMKERQEMSEEIERLESLSDSQNEVIGEMQGRLDTMVEALERAAQAGLTSVTADEVRNLKRQVDELDKQHKGEVAANSVLEEERQRLREIADRLRGLLDARDRRLAELEEQLERVMQGPRSVSAEHDYLVEQIEELKRRLLDRNREYESLRRRERRLHNDVFERDERIQQMTLTMTDLEAALQDRTAEMRELERQHTTAVGEIERVRKSERTREVVGRVFSDSLNLVRTHEGRQAKKEAYANSPDVEKKLSTPTTEDMKHLAEGGDINLEVSESEFIAGIEVDTDRPASPGGSGDPVIFEDED